MNLLCHTQNPLRIGRFGGGLTQADSCLTGVIFPQRKEVPELSDPGLSVIWILTARIGSVLARSRFVMS